MIACYADDTVETDDFTFSPVCFLMGAERAATEAYRHALHEALVPRHPDALIRLLGDHYEAALQLRDYLPNDETETGLLTPWTPASRVVGSAARFHAPLAGLWALHNAEAQSARHYEACLQNEDISRECKCLVRSMLLPRTHKHLLEIEELIEVLCEEIELVA